MTDDPNAADDAAAPSSPADGFGAAPDAASGAAPGAPAGGSALERLRALAAERASAAAREAVAPRQVVTEPPAPPAAPPADAGVDVVATADDAEPPLADLSDAPDPEADESSAVADEPADEPADEVVEELEDEEPAGDDEPSDAVEDDEPAGEPLADEEPADEPLAPEEPADEPLAAEDPAVEPLADEPAAPAAGPPDPDETRPAPLPPLPVSTDDGTAEPATEAGGFGVPEAPPSDDPRGRGRLVVLTLGGLLAAAAITFGVLFVLAHGKVADRQKVVDRREAARAAAVQTFSDLTTVDYNDQAGYTARLSADTTGGLHDQIGSSAGSLFQTIFVPAKEVLKGTPVRAAVSFSGGDTTTARALVLGHVLLTATSLPAGKEEVAGYAFHLKLVDGRWLVDTAASLGGGDTGTSSPSTTPSTSPSPSPATEPSASAKASASAPASSSPKASGKASASSSALPPPAPPASSAGGNG